MIAEPGAAENLCQNDDESLTREDEFWLFGYGSLIWKPPPHFDFPVGWKDLRVPGYIKGYVRRFWQARSVDRSFPDPAAFCEEALPYTQPHISSEDHRGTIAKPGRVVTLIERSFWETLKDDDDSESTSELVWGAAYRIPLVYKDEVKANLDIREINGYTIEYVDFYPYPAIPTTTNIHPPEQYLPIKTLLYIGLPTNPNFLGVQHPSDVAEVIAKSKGPSGENAEYLFMLEEALENLGLGSRDDHINKLSSMVRRILGEQLRQNDGGGNHGSERLRETTGPGGASTK